jgi:tetratricopeptide (TPR) repeat protein
MRRLLIAWRNLLIWACRYERRRHDRTAVWEFEQPEVKQQIVLLRQAVSSEAFSKLDSLRRCQILTNLGNQMSTLGRFIEAQAYWGKALAILPDFWMARGNRGNGLMFYAAALFDPGHQAVFALHAHRDLRQAAKLSRLHPHSGNEGLTGLFAAHADQVALNFDLGHTEKTYRPDEWSLGRSRPEQQYRSWALKNVLFLNPLNDVTCSSIAATDTLGLPSFTTGFDEPPVVIGMLNELKQAYVSARWLLWEGMNSGSVHFSDRNVMLYNTLDYPCYGLAIEKQKMAFKSAYSIL